ncbi:MAG TPA: acetyltransferase [Blastocatellia bacterium]|nr:acetyltransferase [Blastocatellia bacterium]
MKRLLIIGAGGFGREVMGWASHANRDRRDWEVGGFLDSNPKALDGYGREVGIVGDPLTYTPSDTDLFVCAIGDPATKLRVCKELKERGASFLTLIHPTAVVGLDCVIGEGCVLCPGAVVTTNVTLGSFVCLNVYSTVGHDAVIGDGCTLSAHTDVTGFARLGEGVFLGSHASILPNATVGDYAVVGAGSVVLRKVRPRSTVVGVPAKQISGFDAE